MHQPQIRMISISSWDASKCPKPAASLAVTAGSVASATLRLIGNGNLHPDNLVGAVTSIKYTGYVALPCGLDAAD